jgi:hypothetical protein
LRSPLGWIDDCFGWSGSQGGFTFSRLEPFYGVENRVIQVNEYG